MSEFKNSTPKETIVTNQDVIDFCNSQGLTVELVLVENNEVTLLRVKENTKDSQILLQFPELVKI